MSEAGSEVQSGSGVDEGSIDNNDLAEFKQVVFEYMALPEKIKQSEEPVKQLKSRHKECEKTIIDFMRQRGIKHCKCPEDVGGGMLVLGESVTKAPIKKDNWSRGTEEFFKKRGIQANFSELEKEVDATRDTVEKYALKRRKK